MCQLPGTGLSHADLLLAFSGPQVLGRQTRSKQLHGSPRNRGALQQAPQPQPCSNELLPTPVPPTPSLSQKMTTVFVQLLRTRSLAASGPANPAGNAPVRPTGSAFKAFAETPLPAAALRAGPATPHHPPPLGRPHLDSAQSPPRRGAPCHTQEDLGSSKEAAWPDLHSCHSPVPTDSHSAHPLTCLRPCPDVPSGPSCHPG